MNKAHIFFLSFFLFLTNSSYAQRRSSSSNKAWPKLGSGVATGVIEKRGSCVGTPDGICVRVSNYVLDLNIQGRQPPTIVGGNLAALSPGTRVRVTYRNLTWSEMDYGHYFPGYATRIVILGSNNVPRADTVTNIRRVDFKNFDYGQLCDSRDRLVLRRGRQKWGEGVADTVELKYVKYVDFDGDGQDEAFVVIDGSTSGSSGSFLVTYVFAYRNGSAQAIWRKCNERSSAELRGREILFTHPEYVGNDAHCCPSYITTDIYGWKNSRMTLISQRRKPSGYE